MIILKQIVWETHKWHKNLRKANRSWIIDQNMQTIGLINTSWVAWPSKILFHSLSFWDNLLQYAYIFPRNDDYFEMYKTWSIFSLGCSFLCIVW